MRYVAIFIFAFVIVGLIGASMLLNDNGDDSPHEVGEWYEVYTETATIDFVNGHHKFKISEFQIAEKHHPFVIDSISNNNFIGKFNDIPVTGAFVNGHFSFNIVDKKAQCYIIVDGKVSGDTISMAVCKFTDETLMVVASGTYSMYVHHDVDTVPKVEGYFDFSKYRITNPVAYSYTVGSDGDIVREHTDNIYDVSLYGQKYMTYITNYDVNGVQRPFIGINLGYNNGMHLCHLIGNITDKVALSGTLTTADKKMIADYSVINIIGNPGAPVIQNVTVTFDVSYDHGKRHEPANVRGTWVGSLTVTDLNGNIVDSVDNLIYDVSAIDGSFCGVPKNIDAQVKPVVWLGFVYGHHIRMVSSVGNLYFNDIIGVIDGDTMCLSGSTTGPDGKDASLTLRFHRL